MCVCVILSSFAGTAVWLAAAVIAIVHFILFPLRFSCDLRIAYITRVHTHMARRDGNGRIVRVQIHIVRVCLE